MWSLFGMLFCVVFFLFIEIEVVFVHLVLWVDFSVGCFEESEAVLVWQEQSY